MAMFERFDLTTLGDLTRKLETLGLYLPVSDNMALLGEKVPLGSRSLPNRFVVQPVEGADADPQTSGPSELTFRRYERYARGGSGVIWFEAAAVCQEGRSNPRQLMLTSANLDAWKRLTEQIRRAAMDLWGHEILLILQLSHSGRWSRPFGRPRPVIIHHDQELGAIHHIDETFPLITDDELEVLKASFIENSRLASRAGFDAVDMKAVHGYLTSEMLCAHTRKGRYGGDYENRTRFVRECTAGIADVLGRDQFVTARLTMYEPSEFPFGWGVSPESGSRSLDLQEPLRFARELVDLGSMPVFNYSLGYPGIVPYMSRPFNKPVAGGAVPPEHPLEGIERFQSVGRQLQRALGETPVVTATLGWLRHLFPYVASGLVEEGWVRLIGQGRGSLAYPESAADILSDGRMKPEKCCLACSACSQIMKDGVGRNGCPVHDGKIYRSELLKGRRASGTKGL